MAIWDRIFRGSGNVDSVSAARDAVEIVVGAKDTDNVTNTFSDKNITYSGDLTGYDYNAI